VETLIVIYRCVRLYIGVFCTGVMYSIQALLLCTLIDCLYRVIQEESALLWEMIV
jgi:hypothetical protein